MSATPTGPSDEPTDLSVGGGRDREERDRERQERERYYRYISLRTMLIASEYALISILLVTADKNRKKKIRK